MTATGDTDSQAGWRSSVPVGTAITLPPDPHIMDAIGRNHRLETAVADLVDNAVDAGATQIRVRFVVADDCVRSFYLVDDGRGMSSAAIDAAMVIGGVRQYSDTDLGHFGLGLKASSFSQADSLTVISKAQDTPAVGRRWLTTKASSSFECDIVDTDFCDFEIGRDWGFIDAISSGTVIRWDAVRTFPTGSDASITSRFIQDTTVRLQHHLGLVFHRFIQQGTIRIGIDVEDVSAGVVGPVIEVKHLDPFEYSRPGATGYPRHLRADMVDRPLTVVCHVWPGRSQLPQFRLPGAQPDRFQGLYLYRRDRLLQAGGWNNVEVQRRDLQLARVAIDLDDDLLSAGHFRMNPEKSRVETGPEFADALARGMAEDGKTFKLYIEDAARAFKESNQRTRTRSPIAPLGRGVPPRVRRAVRTELTAVPGVGEVDLRWRTFSDSTFFDIDRGENVIWLNVAYRSLFTGVGNARFNDAPLIKTLVFLLIESLFHGNYMGPKDRDNFELWQTLLTVAATAELE